MSKKKVEKRSGSGAFYVAASLAIAVVLGSIVSVVAYSGQNNGTVIENQTVQGDYVGSGQNNDNPTFGAFPGPDVYSDLNVYGSVTVGGDDYLSTTTNGTTQTLGFRDLNNYTVLDIQLNEDSTTLTLPATSTLNQILPSVGATRDWLIHNASTTAAKTVTLAAGTGSDFDNASSTAGLVVQPDKWAEIKCTRVLYDSNSNLDVKCLYSPWF